MVGLMLSDGGTTKKATTDAGSAKKPVNKGTVNDLFTQGAGATNGSGVVKQQSLAAPTPVPRLSAPITADNTTGTGYTNGYQPTQADISAQQAAADPTPKVDPDAYKQDSTYIAAMAALKKAMGGYTADHDRNLTTYDTDYNTGLQNLGWNSDTKGWDSADTNTAYGRSYDNQLNDYGARDMLQSSFYGDALNNMLRQYNDQKSSIDTARTNYRSDQDSALQAQQDQNTVAQNNARAEAIARLAAGVSIGG